MGDGSSVLRPEVGNVSPELRLGGWRKLCGGVAAVKAPGKFELRRPDSRLLIKVDRAIAPGSPFAVTHEPLAAAAIGSPKHPAAKKKAHNHGLL
jgi:hypothetical protein